MPHINDGTKYMQKRSSYERGSSTFVACTASTVDLVGSWAIFNNYTGEVEPQVSIDDDTGISCRTTSDSAGVEISYIGESIELAGDAENCTFDVVLDGQRLEVVSQGGILASGGNKSQGKHQASIKVHPESNGYLSFRGFWVYSSDVSSYEFVAWSERPHIEGAWQPGSDSNIGAYQYTDREGDFIDFNTTGISAIKLLAMRDADGADYSVEFNGTTTEATTKAPFRSRSDIFVATGLDPNAYYYYKLTKLRPEGRLKFFAILVVHSGADNPSIPPKHHFHPVILLTVLLAGLWIIYEMLSLILMLCCPNLLLKFNFSKFSVISWIRRCVTRRNKQNQETHQDKEMIRPGSLVLQSLALVDLPDTKVSPGKVSTPSGSHFSTAPSSLCRTESKDHSSRSGFLEKELPDTPVQALKYDRIL